MLNFLKKSIAQGVLIVLPLLFLIWVLKAAIGLSAELLEPFSKQLFSLRNSALYEELLWFKIVKFFVLCFIVGIAYELISKLSFAQKVDAYIIRKLPFYNYMKSVLFRFAKKEKFPFKEVAYIKMNAKGDLALGFISEKINNDKWAVFIPTSPNPTTGSIRIMAKEDIYLSNLSIEKAISILITCGSGIENNSAILMSNNN